MSCGCRPQNGCGRPNKMNRWRQTTDDAKSCNVQDDRRRANEETAARQRDIEERVKDIEALADKARRVGTGFVYPCPECFLPLLCGFLWNFRAVMSVPSHFSHILPLEDDSAVLLRNIFSETA